MAVQITPYQGFTPLKGIAFGNQVRQGQQRLAQNDRRIGLSERQIDMAAQQLGLRRDEFLHSVWTEAIANSENAEQAAQYLSAIYPMAPEAQAKLMSMPPEMFGSALREKFGSAVKDVIGPDGKPAFAQFGDKGGSRIIPDITPRSRSGQTINVNTGSENALQGALVEDQADEFKVVQQQGRDAAGIIQQLNVARSIDVDTAPFEDKMQVAREIGDVFGFSVDEKQLSNVAAFDAVMGTLVNDRISQEKGPQTDQDVVRFRKTMASVNNTSVAKDFLLNYAEALERRKVHKARFFRSGVRGKKDYEDILDEYQSYMDKTPLIRTDFRDLDTGLPVFYYEFEREYLKENPGSSAEEALAEWRKE